MRNRIIETALITVIALLVYLLEPRSGQLLAYYHTGIASFELWRLLTATFCHSNFNHLLINIAGLIITLFLFSETFKIRRIWPLLVFNSLFIGLALFFFEPNVIWYVGLSGVLHGLFSYGVLSDIGNKDRWGYLLGSGFLVKIIYEQIYGAPQSTLDLIAAPVLVNAHLYGALAGAVFYLAEYLLARKKLAKKQAQ